MHLLSSILLAFSASLDSLIIGLAYGIKKIKIGILSNLVIATIVTLGTFVSMYLGLFLSSFMNNKICNLIGSGLLIIMGIWMLYDYYRKSKHENNLTKEHGESLDYDDIIINDKTADIDGSGTIDIKESVSLALALSLNNFALGLGASISGISIPITTIFTFIFSILTLILGLKIGNSILSKIFGKYSPILAAIIILGMGIFQLF